MSRSIRIEVPHPFPPRVALRRLRRRMEKVQQQYASHLEDVEVAWGETDGAIKVRALGQTMTATVQAAPRIARIAVELPLLAGLMSDRIKAFLERQAVIALTEGRDSAKGAPGRQGG